MWKRLANLRQRRGDTRTRLLVIGPDSDGACIRWDPVNLPQATALGLISSHRHRAMWAGQAPLRQPSLADVITRYRLSSQGEKNAPLQGIARMGRLTPT
jgi:hypothetical protein